MALRIFANGMKSVFATRKVIMSIGQRQMVKHQPLPLTLIKLRTMQEEFQKDDGKAIWEKRTNNALLYRITLLLCALGLFGVACLIYDQAKPPAWRARDAQLAKEKLEDEEADAIPDPTKC